MGITCHKSILGSSKWETSKTNPQSFQSAHRRQSWTVRNPTGYRSWKPMAPWYHTTKVHNLQIVTVLQSHSTILPQSTFCRLTQYYSLHYSFHQPPPTTNHHKAPNTTSQDHQRPRTTTHQESQKKHIDPKAPKAPKATGKKNRKDKNPLYYICWARIAQWLERWSCKPLVMGSIPGCGGHSAKRQSAIRNKD